MDRRRFLRSVGATGVGGSSLLAGCSGGGGGENNAGGTTAESGGKEEIELVWASAIGEDTWTSQNGYLAFFERLKENSDGAFSFDTHWGGSMGGTGEQHQMVREGAVDVIATLPHYFDYWEQLNAPNMPGIIETLESSGPDTIDPIDWHIACNIEMMEGGFCYEDFRKYGVQIGFNHTNTDMLVFTTEEAGKLMEPADWKGLTISNSTAFQTNAIDALGAASENVDFTEWYQALDSGVIDGVIDYGGAMEIFDGHKVAPLLAENYPLDRYTNPLALNLDTYKSLSPELQNTWDETAWEFSMDYMYERLDYIEQVRSKMVDEGAEMYQVPESTRKTVNETLKPKTEEFLKEKGAYENYQRFVELADHVAKERAGETRPKSVDDALALAPDDHPVVKAQSEQ